MPTTWKNAFADGPCKVSVYATDPSGSPFTAELQWTGSLGMGESHSIDDYIIGTVAVSTEGVVSVDIDDQYSGGGIFVTVDIPSTAAGQALRISDASMLTYYVSGLARSSDDDAGTALVPAEENAFSPTSPDPCQLSSAGARYWGVWNGALPA